MRDEPQPRSGGKAMAELAASQHGVVSSQQLQKRLGFSSSTIGRLVRAGRLHPVHRGVYAVGYDRPSRHGRLMAAALACGRNAVLSHRSAAWLWGIARGNPLPAEVTVPVARRARTGLRLHRARSLPPTDRATVSGIPVTSPHRTLLDLAALLSERRLGDAVERAELLGLFDLRAVEDVLSRNRGHQGAARLRRTLALYRDDGRFVRSPLERRFLDLVEQAGLPRPSTNVYVEGYELDAYWERERFAVELDGFEHHRTRRAFERDRRRQEDLKLAGIEMLRVTARRLDEEPKLLAERLATLLARRRAG